MSDNNNELRVLSRMGAREITSEEAEQISGSSGFIPTLLSVIVTNTPTGGYDDRLDT